MSTDFAFGPFILDAQRGRLLREGRPVVVSSKGLQLLEALVGSAGRVLTKTELMRAAWSDAAVEESNLSVQIAALRKQLGTNADGGDWIVTIPRVGYRFVGQSRFRKSAQDDKWSFCLTVGTLCPANQERP
jgi:DNA-binding winged helix-turn-helix (wHTH) protein